MEAATKTIQDQLEEWLDKEAEIVGQHCARCDQIDIAMRAMTYCSHCGQSLPALTTCVTWHGGGHESVCPTGGHNHQHGCGAWQGPVEVTISRVSQSEALDVDFDAAMDAAAAELRRRIGEVRHAEGHSILLRCAKQVREWMETMRSNGWRVRATEFSHEVVDADGVVVDGPVGYGGIESPGWCVDMSSRTVTVWAWDPWTPDGEKGLIEASLPIPADLIVEAGAS